jgi:uncharacterized protein (DUF302 family)
LEEKEMKYGYKRKVEYSFDEAVLKVREELEKEGFGILSEINVEEKFRDKLGIEFGKYVILGACNPKLAHEVLSKEIDAGLLLPCNVVVYETNGDVIVSVVLPSMMMSIMESDELEDVAMVAEVKLLKAINAV